MAEYGKFLGNKYPTVSKAAADKAFHEKYPKPKTPDEYVRIYGEGIKSTDKAIYFEPFSAETQLAEGSGHKFSENFLSVKHWIPLSQIIKVLPHLEPTEFEDGQVGYIEVKLWLVEKNG
jgi:hypothetical protein